MFTTNHFIWLAISAVIIASYVLLNKFFKLSLKTNLTILFVLCAISEIVKTSVNIELITNSSGKEYFYLDKGDLPFHLCSIQVFFAIAARFFIKKEDTLQKLLCFMFPTMLVGGAIALFIPTVGVKFSNPQVYQFFIFHAGIVGFALYLVIFKVIKIDFKVMFRNFGLLALLVFIALNLNTVLLIEGQFYPNFFYLARPPMNNLPLLNLDHGWYVYFLTLLALGVILLGGLQLPFCIVNKIKEKSILK